MSNAVLICVPRMTGVTRRNHVNVEILHAVDVALELVEVKQLEPRAIPAI